MNIKNRIGRLTVKCLEILHYEQLRTLSVIRAFSKFTATKGATGSIPGKNDFVDLHHLLYLGNKKDCVIVSNDKMIQEINEQTIGVDDFRNLHLTGAKNP